MSHNPYNNATTNSEQETLKEKEKSNTEPEQIVTKKSCLIIMNDSSTSEQNQNLYQEQ